MENAAATGIVVGVQWFAYLDEPVTSRWHDHEAFNSGLVDVTDRPYETFVTACRETNDGIYEVLAGRRSPLPATAAADRSQQASHPAPLLSIARLPTGLSPAFPLAPADWPPSKTGGRIDRSYLVSGYEDGSMGQLSADFLLAWDQTALHLIVKGTDGTPLMNQHEKDLWSGDCVELFIGPEHSSGDSPVGPLRPDDRQILFRLASEDVGRAVRYAIINGPDHAIETRLTRAPGGYVLEARIPFAALGVKPQANKKLAFDLGIDDSVDGCFRVRQLMWSGSPESSKSSAYWASAVLAP